MSRGALVQGEYEPPQGPVEQALADIWTELLRIERVGRRDHFFEIGGHSLLATRMVLAINQRWADAVQLKDIFEQQSLAGLALHIDVKRVSASAAQPDGANGGAVYEEMEL